MDSDGTSLRKRSVVLAGHSTSVSLENAFWDALKGIAEKRGQSVNAVITEIDQQRTGSLSGALRVFILNSVKK